MSTDHIATVESFFAQWGKSFEDCCQSFRDTFAPEGTWIAGPGIPTTTGAEGAIALLEQFKAGYDMGAIGVEMVSIAQSGNRVHTERIDTILDSKGEVIVPIPVAGVLTLDDSGRITHYVDYWDMRELESKALSA